MAIRWNEYLDNKMICLEAVLDAKTWEAVAKQLREVFETLFTRIGKDLKPTDWNRIYLEFWPDSGRVIAYPHKRGKTRDVRRLSMDIEIPALQQEHDKLPSAEHDQHLFESHYGALMGKLGLALSRSLRSKSVQKQLSKLAEQTDFTVWEQDADDAKSATERTVIY